MAIAKKLVLLAVFTCSAASAQTGGGGGGYPGGGGGGGGHGGHGDFGGAGMGHRPEMRALDPVKRDKFDKAVTAMFREADANHDNVVTLDELQGVIAAKRETLIRARFQHVDRDSNGSIDFAEFSAWQTEMGSVALSDEAALGGRTTRIGSVIQPPLDKDDHGLARLIEPLGATVIIDADANSDGKVTLEELLAHEHLRFDAADKDHDGAISMEEMRVRRGADDSESPGEGGFGRRRQP